MASVPTRELAPGRHSFRRGLTMTVADQWQATAAATNWLALVDDGKYDQSWNEASKLFRERVTQAQWASEAKTVREPLGIVHSRAAQAAQFVTSLPGVPDGDYAVLQFRSKFAHNANAIETVTVMIQDGAWRAAGYFIK
jgi:hypothetical protein